MSIHRTVRVCATSRTLHVLTWQSRCRDCPWRGDEYPVTDPDPLADARIDGRAHELNPDGADGIAAAFAAWSGRR